VIAPGKKGKTMGNPQHLEWLLEGVEAWNARQEREQFRPEFFDTNIRAAFIDAGKLTGGGRIPLIGADLGGAAISARSCQRG